jgi:hypothetical protein
MGKEAFRKGASTVGRCKEANEVASGEFGK